jgi:hypothetical protein
MPEQRDFDQLWTHGGNKFVIGTIHGAPIEIIAQYNPKELSRQATATWTPHQNTSARYSDNGESKMWSQYATTAPRSMTLELLFDGYEEGKSIAPIVANLERLTIPVDMSSRDETKRRPQLCVAVWGKQQLRCVVTSVATKLTMFDTAGEPLRASCTVVLTEVDVVAMLKTDVSDTIEGIAAKSGNVASTKPRHDWPYPPEDMKPTKVPPPKPAPANTVGKPSAQVDPSSMDGKSPVFGGTPSKRVDPNSMDGKSDVFGENPPAKTEKPDAISSADSGTADPKYKAAAEDME